MKIMMKSHKPELPPNGEYDALIMNAEDKISQAGRDMIELDIKLLGVNSNVHLREYIVDNEYANEKAARILASAGVYPPDNSAIDNADFVGKKVRVRIASEPDSNGVTRLRIKYWAPRPKNEPVKEELPF